MKKLLISTVLALLGASAQAASFDCAKASKPIEKTICADAQLSELDSQLMSAYKKSLADSPNADAVKAEQRLWLKEVRSSCQDAACLKQAYTGRISALTAAPAATPIESNHAEQAIAQTNNAAPTTPAIAQTVAASAPTPTTFASASPPREVKNESAAAKKDDNASPPSAGISGIFNAVYFVLTALFIAGLVNPKWILRWDANPNRKKLAGYFFAIALPIGLLGEFTKSEATRKYEAELIAAKEAEKKAMIEKQRQVESQRISQNSNHPSRIAQPRQESGKPVPLWMRYYAAINVNSDACENLKSIIQGYVQSGIEENQLNIMARDIYKGANEAGCVQ